MSDNKPTDDKAMEYEYGIMQRGIPGLHRGPMLRENAEAWVQEWIDDCIPAKQDAIRDMFYVVRRPVGEWERYD